MGSGRRRELSVDVLDSSGEKSGEGGGGVEKRVGEVESLESEQVEGSANGMRVDRGLPVMGDGLDG